MTVASAKLATSSIGSPELYVRFKNESSTAIDRIDFNVKCCDAYGDKIPGYDVYDYNECYYDETKINPGGKSLSNYYGTCLASMVLQR